LSKITKDTHLAQIITSLAMFWTGIIFLYAHPEVVYYNIIKFHQYKLIH